MKARELDESEGYLLPLNELLKICEDLSNFETPIRTSFESRGINSQIAQDLILTINKALNTTESANTSTKNTNLNIKENFETLDEYKTNLNAINTKKLKNIKLVLQNDFNFSVIKGNKTFYSSSFDEARPQISSTVANKMKIRNYCFFVKKSSGDGERNIKNQIDEHHAMEEEDHQEEIEILDNSNKIKPVNQSDLMKNLHSLNISDNLRNKFMKSIQTADVQKNDNISTDNVKPDYFVTSCRKIEDELSQKMKGKESLQNIIEHEADINKK